MPLHAQLHSRFGRSAALPAALAALAVAAPAVQAAPPAPLPESTGTAYYVSPSGSDSGSGSLSSPWKSIGKALSAGRPGARILVRGGSYGGDVSSGADGASGQTMTLENYPGERPVLNVKLTLKGASYLRLRGLTFEGNSSTSGTAIRVDGSSNVEISNSEIKNYRNGGSSQAILIGSATTTNLHVLRNRIHDTGIWDQYDHGIYCKSSKAAYIANNLFYNLNRGYGIQLYNGDGGAGCDGSLIVNNTIDNVRESGLVVSKLADDNVIENNLFTNNTSAASGDHGFAVRQGSGAGKGNVVRNNMGFGNRQATQFECSVCSMSNNVKADPRYAGRSSGDFGLLAGSGALDKALGTNIPAVDFLGVTRGGSPDVGALELGNGAPDPDPDPDARSRPGSRSRPAARAELRDR